MTVYATQYHFHKPLTLTLLAIANSHNHSYSNMTEPTLASLHPSELLIQLSNNIRGRISDLSITIPWTTTWLQALKSTADALKDVDAPITFIPRRKDPHRSQILREMAIRNKQDFDANPTSTTFSGLPIRSNVDLKALGPPQQPSSSSREQLKENARNISSMPDPYNVVLRAGITEMTLPVVRGNITLRGVDAEIDHPWTTLSEVEMLWDTGCHQTVITEELLPESFRDYLKDEIHEPLPRQKWNTGTDGCLDRADEFADSYYLHCLGDP